MTEKDFKEKLTELLNEYTKYNGVMVESIYVTNQTAMSGEISVHNLQITTQGLS